MYHQFFVSCTKNLYFKFVLQVFGYHRRSDEKRYNDDFRCTGNIVNYVLVQNDSSGTQFGK